MGWYRKYFIFAFLCISTFSGICQEEGESIRKLSNQEIEAWHSKVNSHETKKKIVLKDLAIEPKKVESQKNPIKSIPNVNFPILKFLLYALIGALIAFIIYAIFRNIDFQRKVEVNVEDVDDIKTIDAKKAFDEFLSANDYRSALRMLFIQVLQKLVSQNAINWKPEKTNRHYLLEMKGHSNINEFRSLVYHYEKVWYGFTSIDKAYFESLRGDFEKFINPQINILVDEE